jgi:hypothetical protein
MVKEGSLLEFTWKLHLQWHRGVFFVWSWSFTALRDTIGRPLIENVCHDVVASSHLGPCCWHARWCLRGWWKHALIGWYEVSCSLLLMSLLTWVLKKLNGRLPLMLLMTSWFVCPLPVIKCFYFKSFLLHLSHFLFILLLKWWFGCSQIHTKPWTGTTYIHSFLQNVNGHIPEGI